MKTVLGDVTIGAAWASFRRQVMPAEASDAQVSDMRSAFYAGAFIVLETFQELANIDNDVVSVLVLGLLQREKQAFVNEVHRAAEQERRSKGEHDDGL